MRSMTGYGRASAAFAGGTLTIQVSSVNRRSLDLSVKIPGVWESLEAEVGEPGIVIVPGRLLAEITRSLPALAVEITTDADAVNLTCGSAEFTLFALPAEEYPDLPAAPPLAGVVDDFRRLADRFAGFQDRLELVAGRQLDGFTQQHGFDQLDFALGAPLEQPLLGPRGRLL